MPYTLSIVNNLVNHLSQELIRNTGKGMLNSIDVQESSPSNSTAGAHLDIKSGSQFEHKRIFVVMPLHHEDSGSLASPLLFVCQISGHNSLDLGRRHVFYR